MKVKVGKGELDVSNSLMVRLNGECVDLTGFYSEYYDYYPVYRCDYIIHCEDMDESFDVYQAIYKDLIGSGDFIPLRYEYDYADNDEERSVARYYLISVKEPVGVSFEFGSMTIMSHMGEEVINSTIEKYLKKYDQVDETAKCYIIVKDQDLYLKDFSVKMEGNLDFDLYNEGFEDVHKNIVSSIKEDKNGLYLLYGCPGTGKTTYIRHLIKECATDKRKFVYVPSNLFGDFTNPSLVPFLMDHRGCVFIIEDCESLVTVENGVRSAELTDLLNMTDGLLADALDIKIICTFNIDDGKIDDALLRPGRCKCRYEFELLDKDRANKAAEKLGLNKVGEDTSLADLFNTGKSFVEKKKKLGFR